MQSCNDWKQIYINNGFSTIYTGTDTDAKSAAATAAGIREALRKHFYINILSNKYVCNIYKYV